MQDKSKIHSEIILIHLLEVVMVMTDVCTSDVVSNPVEMSEQRRVEIIDNILIKTSYCEHSALSQLSMQVCPTYWTPG